MDKFKSAEKKIKEKFDEELKKVKRWNGRLERAKEKEEQGRKDQEKEQEKKFKENEKKRSAGASKVAMERKKRIRMLQESDQKHYTEYRNFSMTRK